MRFALRLVLGAVVVALPGCGDLATSGSAVDVTAPETVPSLRFESELPTLPSVVGRWGSDLPLDGLVKEWHRSWNQPVRNGAPVRAELNGAAAELLAPRVDVSRVEARLEELEGTLGRVGSLAGEALPEGLALHLAEARTEQDRAVRALEGGDRTGAIRHLLSASDVLWQLTPERVATWLVVEAEAGLRRNGDDRAYTEETRERAQRLLAGAREALDDGASVRALERAWYAVQLLAEPTGS